MELGKKVIGATACAAVLANCVAASAMAAPGKKPLISTSKLAAVATQKIAGGGESYEYNIGGFKTVFAVPPKGFNPLTASDGALKKYGFPARPTDKAKLAKWLQLAENCKTVSTPQVLETNFKHQVKGLKKSVKTALPGKAKNASYESYNWAGYVNTADGGDDSYYDVAGTFAQPTELSDSAPDSYESSWVGLGGFSSGSLIQSGTVLYGNSYAAWVEWLGNDGSGVPMVEVPSVTIDPGDTFDVEVYYDTTAQKAYFILDNQTNGNYQIAYVQLDSDTYFDGTSAEWIDERPEVDGELASLADYGNNFWFNCEEQNTEYGVNRIGTRPYGSIAMVGYSGDVLSGPGTLLLNKSSFDDDYYAAF